MLTPHHINILQAWHALHQLRDIGNLQNLVQGLVVALVDPPGTVMFHGAESCSKEEVKAELLRLCHAHGITLPAPYAEVPFTPDANALAQWGRVVAALSCTMDSALVKSVFFIFYLEGVKYM